MADKTYSVSVKGLKALESIPDGLDKAQREFLGEAADKIAEEVSKAAPHRAGHLASSWHGHTISSTEAVVESDSPYAKSQDRGAYITPKNGKVLRFTVNGQTVFSRFVRLKGTNYVKRGLRTRGTIIRKVYQEKFGELELKND